MYICKYISIPVFESSRNSVHRNVPCSRFPHCCSVQWLLQPCHCLSPPPLDSLEFGSEGGGVESFTEIPEDSLPQHPVTEPEGEPLAPLSARLSVCLSVCLSVATKMTAIVMVR